MVPALLAMTLLLGATGPADADPAALVAQLGAPKFADREAATLRLEALGGAALPALRAAVAARDPEVRARALALRDRIESTLIVRPTLVTLDFRDRPTAEVVAAVGKRAGMPLSFEPRRRFFAQSRRITLEAAEPVPFWSAVDRLSRVGRLQYSAGPVASVDGGPAVPSLVFVEGNGRPAPTSDSGPFRVKLTSVHLSRDLNFEAPDGPPVPDLAPADEREADAPAVIEQFHVQLQVLGEPRLMLAQTGPARLIEAVDDLGQSLKPPQGAEAPELPVGFAPRGRLGGIEVEDDDEPNFAPGEQVQFQVELNRPPHPGKAIGRLRGVVPLAVAGRRPDPLTIRLADATGRQVRNGEFAVTIHAVRVDADGTQIELTFRPERAGGGPGVAAAIMGRLEVVDAKGRILPWGAFNADVQGDAARLGLQVTPAPDQGSPALLRVYGLVRAPAEVPFEFRDIRMP
ncbi:MAG TPA: hypothetical protein VG406_05825 [Isosphaeraceae bacterium]|jgi:hypothetical protein|nr:hypothetical protein [Isosphaeraceae bacterium]